MERWPGKRAGLVAGTAAMVILLAHAFSYRFVCDDAFISFRYARNLLDHGELVYNLGERVEGISNLLWTLLIAACLGLGVDPVIGSQVLGAVFASATALVTFQLAVRLRRDGLGFERGLADGLPAVILSLFPGFAAWTTGGLETQLYTLLFTIAWASWLCRRAFVAGVCIGLGGLTRPEGALLLLPLVLHAFSRRDEESAGRVRRVASLIVSSALLLVPAALWRRGYYGDWLPNTYYAKGPAFDLWQAGIHYVWVWIVEHGLAVLPFCIWALWRCGSAAATSVDRGSGLLRSWLILSSCIIVVTIASVISVGGDFMVLGRYLVPLLPIAALVVGIGMEVTVRRARATEALGNHRQWNVACAGLGAALVAGSLYVRAGALRSHTTRGLASIGWMDEFVGQGRHIGRWLRDSSDDDARIAITAAGVIPYYSGLWTLDMLGLNDRWIARQVAAEGPRPGHRKHAPLDYLMRSNLDLIIRHPTITEDPSWPQAGAREAWKRLGYDWRSERVPGLQPEWFGYWRRLK